MLQLVGATVIPSCTKASPLALLLCFHSHRPPLSPHQATHVPVTRMPRIPHRRMHAPAHLPCLPLRLAQNRLGQRERDAYHELAWSNEPNLHHIIQTCTRVSPPNPKLQGLKEPEPISSSLAISAGIFTLLPRMLDRARCCSCLLQQHLDTASLLARSCYRSIHSFVACRDMLDRATGRALASTFLPGRSKHAKQRARTQPPGAWVLGFRV